MQSRRAAEEAQDASPGYPTHLAPIYATGDDRMQQAEDANLGHFRPFLRD
jgi:hypothetical protein